MQYNPLRENKMKMFTPKKIMIGLLAVGALWLYSGARGEREIRVQREALMFEEKSALQPRQGYAASKDLEFIRYDTNNGEVVELRYIPTGKRYGIMQDGNELTITGLGGEVVRTVDGLADKLFSEKKEIVQGSALEQKSTDNYQNWLAGGR